MSCRDPGNLYAHREITHAVCMRLEMETRSKLPRSCKIILKVMKSQELLSAHDIFSRMRAGNPKSPGLSTTYRSMEILLKEGFVQSVDLGDTQKLYELVCPGEHHHHLVCDGCGLQIHMEECALDDFRQTLVETYGFCVSLHRLEIFGTCENCTRFTDSDFPAKADDAKNKLPS